MALTQHRPAAHPQRRSCLLRGMMGLPLQWQTLAQLPHIAISRARSLLMVPPRDKTTMFISATMLGLLLHAARHLFQWQVAQCPAQANRCPAPPTHMLRRLLRPCGTFRLARKVTNACSTLVSELTAGTQIERERELEWIVNGTRRSHGYSSEGSSSLIYVCARAIMCATGDGDGIAATITAVLGVTPAQAALMHVLG